MILINFGTQTDTAHIQERGNIVAKGDSKGRSAEEHNDTRRAIKARQRANAKARALSSKKHGSGDLFAQIRADKLAAFLTKSRNERETAAAYAILDVGLMIDGIEVHSENSATFRQGMLAYQAALQMLEVYEKTDPAVHMQPNGYINVTTSSLAIAAKAVEEQMYDQGKCAIEYGINAAREAIRSARKRIKETADTSAA